MYKIEDEAKPDFSLSGVWVQKDVDNQYSNKITQMNQEESIYGFIANTKAMQITYIDIIELQKYVVGVGVLDDPLNDITNLNRIILKIVDTNKHEPIKANITHNTVDKKIEIKVTYTKNGISKILNEYGEELTLTEENKIILADTGTNALGIGTYKFTVIDNKGNKKELRITPNVDSFYKVAYINGTDNMDNTATYNLSVQTPADSENILLNQIKTTDTTKTFSRAIQDKNGLTTAISHTDRSENDEALDIVKLYNIKYPCSVSESYSKHIQNISWYSYGYTDYSVNSGSSVTLSGKRAADHAQTGTTFYYFKNSLPSSVSGNATTYNVSTFYKFVCTIHNNAYKTATYAVYEMTIKQTSNTPNKGTFKQTSIVRSDAYTNNAANGSDWYEKVEAVPKYTLYKYDQNLTLKSTYDVDTKILTTAPIDISNKGRNKIKLTLTTRGTDYKTYISGDNTNWQEVTDITSGVEKELDVDGWNSLYIKIETNTSRIDNMDIAYYKD